jgi:hypothetical protein
MRPMDSSDEQIVVDSVKQMGRDDLRMIDIDP